MESAKRTYALPTATVERFEKEVPPGKRSARVSELLESWISERERQALRQDIVEGCREMWDVYLDTANEWEPIDREADCVLER